MNEIAVTAACLAVIAVATTGCQRSAHVPPPTATVSAPHPEALTVPKEKQASFLLSKVVASIRPGTPIIFRRGDHPFIVTFERTWLCNYRVDRGRTTVWRSGSKVFGNWRTGLGEVFHETLGDLGFNIAGDPKDLFGRNASASAAEFLIGARITHIRGNICHAHNSWFGRPQYTYAGDIYIWVEWIFYSPLRNRELFRLETKGYYNRPRPERGNAAIMLTTAFERAVRELATQEKFIDLALRRNAAIARPAKTLEDQPPIRVKLASLSKRPAKQWLDRILSNVVTIRLANSHGSGFMVSKNGHVLTNAHVVGKAKKVAVRFSNGLEVIGDVVRRNQTRDTALVKIPIRVPAPLPVKMDRIKRLANVFAIGSPLDPKLQSTVTSGVVSAIRNDRGLSYIQADAAISPGNSGGPLIDDAGNVVGISVARIVEKNAQGLNLFIPIGDAFKSLNLLPPGGV